MSHHYHWESVGMAVCQAGKDLKRFGEMVEVPTWQAIDVRDRPQSQTFELCNYSFSAYIGSSERLIQELDPNMPWAENQFLERIGGEPLNPGETYKEWPWYKGNVEEHKGDGRFSHTYMERYWPKQAGQPTMQAGARRGIRFSYGDLNDVVNLLAKEPTTRQAYLPVFFPEDTGAVHGERIPCSLGYLFLMRNRELHITYYIRSCDFYRHFRDDVYMTTRLCQAVLEQLQDPENDLKPEVGVWDHQTWQNVKPGRLTMHIGSLHVFESDLPKLRREYGTN